MAEIVVAILEENEDVNICTRVTSIKMDEKTIEVLRGDGKVEHFLTEDVKELKVNMKR